MNTLSPDFRIMPKMVELKKWVDPGLLVAYLVINSKLDIAKGIEVKPNEKFREIILEHLTPYVEQGTMPPSEIAPAILNIADDFISGRQLTIKAGDYITLNNFLRKRS